MVFRFTGNMDGICLVRIDMGKKKIYFQFGPLLWVLNLIGNNAFSRGFK